MTTQIVYGFPPPALAVAQAGAVQVSPLALEGKRLEDLAENSFATALIYAPPGTLERHYVLAQALRAIAPQGELTVLAAKDKGGSRLRKELESLGCDVAEDARKHHRICRTRRPDLLADLTSALADGAPRYVETIGMWSQPGIFSWDRLDPGSAALLSVTAPLTGKGADFGSGLGVLSRAVLQSPGVTGLVCLDIDRRAVDAARRNIDDPRADIQQADVRQSGLVDLDFVIMNPPFHAGGREDRGLGQAFIAAAAGALRKGGVCRLVANIALPYEAVLAAHFREVKVLTVAGGYKVFEARK